MEVAETLSANFAAMNVASGQRGIYKIGVLPWWRQYVWLAATDFAYFYLLFIFVSGHVGWLQRIGKA